MPKDKRLEELFRRFSHVIETKEMIIELLKIIVELEDRVRILEKLEPLSLKGE